MEDLEFRILCFVWEAPNFIPPPSWRLPISPGKMLGSAQAEKGMKMGFPHLRWRLHYGGVCVMEYGLSEEAALPSSFIKSVEAATSTCMVFDHVPLYWAYYKTA